MFRSARTRAAALGLALLTAGPTAAVEVDLHLVLAVDVSNSMDAAEHRLQRAGYVAAIGHSDVWAAIESGLNRRIAIAYVEWAGPEKQATVVPWRLIDSAEAARAFAADLATPEIFFTRGTGTSISGALAYSAALLRDSPYEGWRRVIDISGDGPNNRGAPVEPARDAVLSQDIVVNGLPLMLRPSRTLNAIDLYYRDCVIGGPGAFVLPVYSADQLSIAIRRKLVLEIAGRTPVPGVVRAQARPLVDCRIGDPPDKS